MKKLLISIILVWGCFLFSGASNASDCLRFVVDDEFLQFEKEDVRKIDPDVDAGGNNRVKVKLTERGQLRLKEFTEKNIGKDLSVYFNDLMVSDSATLRTALSGETLYVVSDDEYISSILMGCK